MNWAYVVLTINWAHDVLTINWALDLRINNRQTSRQVVIHHDTGDNCQSTSKAVTHFMHSYMQCVAVLQL